MTSSRQSLLGPGKKLIKLIWRIKKQPILMTGVYRSISFIYFYRMYARKAHTMCSHLPLCGKPTFPHISRIFMLKTSIVRSVSFTLTYGLKIEKKCCIYFYILRTCTVHAPSKTRPVSGSNGHTKQWKSLPSLVRFHEIFLLLFFLSNSLSNPMIILSFFLFLAQSCSSVT
jgi:hypothetical protein